MAYSRLSDVQIRAACITLRQYLQAGDSEEVACEKMDLTPDEFSKIRDQLYKLESAKHIDRSSDHLYLDYIMNQSKNIKDLTRIIDDSAHASRSSTAAVAAIKTRSDIYNKIIEKGQEFGLIDKRPERKEVISGIIVAQLSDADLRTAIVGKFDEMGSLMAKYSGASAGAIIDLDPGPIHRELEAGDGEDSLLPAVAAAEIKPEVIPGGKTYDKKHSRNRVHKGRRVVKEKIQ